jgi:hypothetical protein
MLKMEPKWCPASSCLFVLELKACSAGGGRCDRWSARLIGELEGGHPFKCSGHIQTRRKRSKASNLRPKSSLVAAAERKKEEGGLAEVTFRTPPLSPQSNTGTRSPKPRHPEQPSSRRILLTFALFRRVRTVVAARESFFSVTPIDGKKKNFRDEACVIDYPFFDLWERKTLDLSVSALS